MRDTINPDKKVTMENAAVAVDSMVHVEEEAVAVDLIIHAGEEDVVDSMVPVVEVVAVDWDSLVRVAGIICAADKAAVFKNSVVEAPLAESVAVHRIKKRNSRIKF